VTQYAVTRQGKDVSHRPIHASGPYYLEKLDVVDMRSFDVVDMRSFDVVDVRSLDVVDVRSFDMGRPLDWPAEGISQCVSDGRV
jgi:hypothetical protein